MASTAKEKLGGVDILLNNAGQMYSGHFAAFSDDDMKVQLETKLFGLMRAIRAVYPMMKAQKWGRIVNAICPGWVATDLWVRNTEGLKKKELNVTTESEARKLAAKKNSLGRIAGRKNLRTPQHSCARTAQATSRASRSTWTAAG